MTATPQGIRVRPWSIVALLASLLIGSVVVVSLLRSSTTTLATADVAALADVIVATDADGRVVTVDPVTGSSRTLASAAGTAIDPSIAPDGRHVAFLDEASPFHHALVVVGADGSDPRTVFDDGGDLYTPTWSPDSRALVVFRGGRDPSLMRIDIGSGRATPVALDPSLGEVHGLTAGPGGDWLLTLQDPDQVTTFGLVDESGGTDRLLTTPGAVNLPLVSLDGRTLGYTVWADGAEGRVHLQDLATGADRALSGPAEAHNEFLAAVSPDAAHVVTTRFTEASGDDALLILRDVAAGTERQLGIAPPFSGERPTTTAAFSPDGTEVAVRYGGDGATWVYEVATGEGRELEAALAPGLVWR